MDNSACNQTMQINNISKSYISKPHKLHKTRSESGAVNSASLVEISIVSINLSETAAEIFNAQYGNPDWKICIRMDFLDHPTESTRLENGLNINYDSIFYYKIQTDDQFFNDVTNRKVLFELAGHCGGIFGTGDVSVKEMIDYPNSRLYTNASVRGKGRNGPNAIFFGNLTIAYRLSCPTGVLNEYKNRISPLYPFIVSEQEDSSSKSNKNPAAGENVPSSTTTSAVADNTVLSSESPESNAYIKFSSCDSSDNDMVVVQSSCWAEEQHNWLRSLQEYAILTGESYKLAEEQEWRDSVKSKVKMRKFSRLGTVYQPIAVIEIHDLKLFQTSPPMRDELIKQLYVEYTFLSHEGEELETPCSVAKPPRGRNMYFGFRKEFPLDEMENETDCNLLAELISSGRPVKFEIVNEPLAEDASEPQQKSYQICRPIGYAELIMQDLIMDDQNSVLSTLLVKDINEPHDEIGVLKISVTGIQAMREIGLKILAPDYYYDMYSD